MDEVTGSRFRRCLRQVVLRAAIFGAYVASAVLGFRLAGGRGLEEVRLVALVGALAGAATLPLAGLELAAGERGAKGPRVLLVLPLLCALGPGAIALAVVQGAFTTTMLEKGSVPTALEGALSAGQLFGWGEPWGVTVAFGLVLVPVVIARLRRLGLLAQLVLALASGRIAGAVVWRGDLDRGTDRERLALLLAFVAAGFALASRAAEGLERRLARRFSWSGEPEPAASVERPRLGWRKGLALALVGVGLVVELSGLGWSSVLDGLRLPWRRAVPWRGPASLPAGLRLAGRKVPAADGTEVELYLWTLPGNAGELELVYVPPGEFTMGAEDELAEADEKPRHVHAMPLGYWIGRTEVTWRQYLVFCEARGQKPPQRPGWAKDDHPVVNVSWDEAKAYGAWAGLALPSEAEWEKAARGTDARRFPWGNEAPTGKLCTFRESYGRKAAGDFLARLGLLVEDHPGARGVDECPLGVSPYGALDMSGNVWEWCEDWYESNAYDRYLRGDTSPPLSGSFRVFRGGCWRAAARGCRSSTRDGDEPSVRDVILGFRVLLRSHS